MTLLELAQKLRPYIEKAAASLSDEDALEAVNLFPTWHSDVAYKKDERVLHDGILYKCLQAHTSQADWTPDTAISLYAEILTGEDDKPKPWVQPDSTNPYMKGDKVKFNGKTYESLIDNNVWSPAGYPAGWKEI